MLLVFGAEGFGTVIAGVEDDGLDVERGNLFLQALDHAFKSVLASAVGSCALCTWPATDRAYEDEDYCFYQTKKH